MAIDAPDRGGTRSAAHSVTIRTSTCGLSLIYRSPTRLAASASLDFREIAGRARLAVDQLCVAGRHIPITRPDRVDLLAHHAVERLGHVAISADPGLGVGEKLERRPAVEQIVRRRLSPCHQRVGDVSHRRLREPRRRTPRSRRSARREGIAIDWNVLRRRAHGLRRTDPRGGAGRLRRACFAAAAEIALRLVMQSDLVPQIDEPAQQARLVSDSRL